MAVEIRELVIRAEVNPRQDESGPAVQGSGAARDNQQLVRDCVEQVMEMIRQKEEP